MILERLLAYTDDFKVSKPIFGIQCTGTEINLWHSKVDKYVPKPIDGDPLSELVCSFYKEHFDANSGVFLIDTAMIAQHAMDSIVVFFRKLIEHNLPMRNPKQSKVYRWIYRDLPNTREVNEALIMLYVYVSPHTDEAYKIAEEYKCHLDNTMAILYAMREKYER